MRDPKIRGAALVLGLPLAVAAGFGVGTLIDHLGAPTAPTALAALIPVISYGWLANRWWVVFPLPAIVGAAYLLVLRVIDWKTGGCSVCGEDEDWSTAPYWFAFTLVIPLTVVLAVAVGARRARDRGRRVRERRQIV